jgi:glycine cleavage system H protein
VYAPVEGEVIDVNSKIGQDPAVVNHSAEKDGWLFKVKVEEEKDLSKLC